MTWFRVDDSFYDHPKVADLPDSAVALWLRAGAYCARHLTDGSVSRRLADRLCDRSDEAIEALLKAGLWIEDGSSGFRFHDWHVYQPTAAEAKQTRDARSIGGAIGNHDRWHVKRNKIDPNCPYCAKVDRKTDRSSDRVPDRSTDRVPEWGGESHANPPSRPVPSRPPKSQNQEPLTVGDSLPRQDHDSASKPKTAPTGSGEARGWRAHCPEHGAQNIKRCDMCRIEHGRLDFWSVTPWTPAVLERIAADERRREILAKVTAERQQAARQKRTGRD